jgi:hypothetical protein
MGLAPLHRLKTMARKPRSGRPSSPEEIARRRAAERERQRDPAAWGVDAAAIKHLPAHAAVEARADGAGRIVRARRADIFEILRARGTLSAAGYEAVRRLQDDMAVLHRTHAGGGDFAPRVDRARDPQAFTDIRHKAGLRIDAALSLAGAASATLLAALCEADVVLGRPGEWRDVVAHQTGERLPDAQGAVLRVACENLAGAYRRLNRA